MVKLSELTFAPLASKTVSVYPPGVVGVVNLATQSFVLTFLH